MNIQYLKRQIAWAVRYLGEALTERDDPSIADAPAGYDMCRHVTNAQKCIEEFWNSRVDIKFTPEESKLSGQFHTYLRKYDDSYCAAIMYKLWDINRGSAAWAIIIKNINNKRDLFDKLNDLEATTDDSIMKWAFMEWSEDGLKPFIDFLKSID